MGGAAANIDDVARHRDVVLYHALGLYRVVSGFEYRKRIGSRLAVGELFIVDDTMRLHTPNKPKRAVFMFALYPTIFERYLIEVRNRKLKHGCERDPEEIWDVHIEHPAQARRAGPPCRE